ncbi:TPA: DUF1642 domain-containing protein [Enterococcus faecium]|uniref:DUF1642 domain-containing protein n=1 Tax=Enterococcus TaxID=1350 RepID=UPI000301489A|nr:MULTISPECIES: DUF1642 domain-containing protein [Enterococcus]MDV4901569.1 DUF1642 domain-containing protein [Enterococcus faecium]MUP20926.1 DUF1642 domain-containing protein [Enterococcus lactis]NTP64169.1 DUF1642 domain-containing protein [Enterococcus faecium]WPL32207.1 DUF1642 domain-containing protein [Enterococcus lactis]HAP8062245.1 DUF1642 domain-containing protein [Enterococcus faecium]
MNKKELIDKQELIDKLTKYVKSYENVMDEHGQGRYGAYEVSLKLAKRLNEQNITDEQAWDKVAEAYPESAQSLRNTLDNAVFGKTGEPQKHVMPKFVADWFEDNKHALDLAIFTKIRELDGKRYPHETDFENWLDNAENNPIETLIRMKDGYEVEKVPKYIVKIGKLYLKEPLGDTSNFTILTTWDKKRAYPFSSFHTADKHADKFEGAVVEVVEG